MTTHREADRGTRVGMEDGSQMIIDWYRQIYGLQVVRGLRPGGIPIRGAAVITSETSRWLVRRTRTCHPCVVPKDDHLFRPLCGGAARTELGLASETGILDGMALAGAPGPCRHLHIEQAPQSLFGLHRLVGSEAAHGLARSRRLANGRMQACREAGGRNRHRRRTLRIASGAGGGHPHLALRRRVFPRRRLLNRADDSRVALGRHGRRDEARIRGDRFGAKGPGSVV
jgi:hypothetical protein